MSLVAFILNVPWTLVGILAGLLSGPRSVNFSRKPFAIHVYVKSFWWKERLFCQKGVRATTSGNVILLGPKLLFGDVAHELVHVAQYQREPLIHPFLYLLAARRHGYRHNKYEAEAYDKAKNPYIS